jgi:hypothetical protein
MAKVEGSNPFIRFTQNPPDFRGVLCFWVRGSVAARPWVAVVANSVACGPSSVQSGELLDGASADGLSGGGTGKQWRNGCVVAGEHVGHRGGEWSTSGRRGRLAVRTSE